MALAGSLLRFLFLSLGANARRRLLAENLLLRQQNLHFKRLLPRPKLRPEDRLLLGFLAGLVSRSRLQKISTLARPATFLTFHRALVAKKYQLLYRSPPRKPGPKGPSALTIRFVIECKQRYPFYGCEKIALLVRQRLGIPISHQTVRRILRKHLSHTPRHPPGPSWCTTLSQAKDTLWALDLFRVESITLQSHWVLVVMDVWSRKLIGFATHKGHVHGEDLCRMFSQIAAREPKPAYLSTDNDPLFRFHQWQANLRIWDITEKRSLPHVPLSHPFIERVIGTTRREFLDYTFFWNQRDLERKLGAFREYYNLHRVHSALHGETPSQRRKEHEPERIRDGSFTWTPVCGGLFHVPSHGHGGEKV